MTVWYRVAADSPQLALLSVAQPSVGAGTGVCCPCLRWQTS